MKPTAFVSVLLVIQSVAGAQTKPLNILRSGVVNDQVVDAVTPGGLVKTESGDLITTFVDKGDSAAGSRCYFVRSTDAGKSWSGPYLVVEPTDEHEGVYTELAKLPDNRLVMLVIRIWHRDSSLKGVFGYRESTIELLVSSDEGQTFRKAGFLDTPKKSLTSTTGALYQLGNGDLIIPAYAYPSQQPPQDGYQYGSGFFRSSDGGKTWGKMEVAFADPPSANETRQGFNETAFAVRNDGIVIAYARVDVHKGDEFRLNRMWRCQSSDYGKTWTKPVETEITGISPMISRLPSGQFVLLCGVRDSPVMRRTTSLFTSSDGIEWSYRGHPHYSRTGGKPWNSATGGSQAMVSMGGNRLYVVFYAADEQLPGRNRTYIDGCLLEL